MSICDLQERKQALNIKQSFIVQAPAGSGKTELLTTRFLALLAHACQRPEEIAAITFTRKAASEMRERILHKLQAAALNLPINSEHERESRALALAVLQQDKRYQWNLLNTPHKLQIFTIDSLCTKLINQMPVLSQIGGMVQISEDANSLYRKASENTLAMLECSNPWQEDLQILINALDNRLDAINNLIVNMLGMRNQWLPYLGHKNEREYLENNLQQTINSMLKSVYEHIPKHCHEEILAIHNFLAGRQHKNFKALKRLPKPHYNELDTWKMITKLWITANQTWRKSVDRRNGFEPNDEGKIYKARQLALIKNLAQVPNLLDLTIDLSLAPNPRYTDAQWQLLRALLTLLPLAAAQLQLVFQEQALIDYVELNIRAMQALTALDSEIAMQLDHQLNHLLIDEFQDTSISQFQLIEELIAHWTKEDSKTLFLVGDPKQSIYRFRQAEVSLFLRAQQYGIGVITLTPVRLSSNFRSCRKLVMQNNALYQQIMPKTDNYELSAIGFSPSEAVIENPQGLLNLKIFSDENSEAHFIIQEIKKLKAEHPKLKIAILAAARNHLHRIIPLLNQEKIAYNAAEIDPLAKVSVVNDLFSLTKALLYQGDKLSWYTILRAPWLGLSLAELLTLSSQPGNTVWEKLKNFQQINTKPRLQLFIHIIKRALNARHRIPLTQWVESVWLSLGGPACVRVPEDLEYAKKYFKLLDEAQTAGDFTQSIDTLEQKIKKIAVTKISSADHPVEIMTIHKAKGLEFDAVFLPGLNRKTRPDNKPLLTWLEQPQQDQSNFLLLAPIKTEKKEPIYDFIHNRLNKKGQHELIRKLYVATTRAKIFCYLSAAVKNDEDEIKTSGKSLLAIIKPHFSDCLHPENIIQSLSENLNAPHGHYTRLHETFQHPFNAAEKELPTPANPFKLDFTAHYEAIIGTTAHKLIEIYSIHSHLSHQDLLNFCPALLRQNGLPETAIASALSLMSKAVTNLLKDKNAQFILTPHQEAKSEYAISVKLDKTIQNYIIDRTFIYKNERYIIDYKFKELQKLPLQVFLEQQQNLYHMQLKKYCEAFQKNENLPIKLALYFPLLPYLLFLEE